MRTALVTSITVMGVLLSSGWGMHGDNAMTSIPPVHAQKNKLPSVVDTIVGTSLPKNIPTGGLTCPSGVGTGACRMAALFVYIVQQGRLLIASVAIAFGIAAAFRLVISQSDEAIATARRTILGIVVGIFLVFIAEPIVDGFYGGFTTAPNTRLDSLAHVDAGVRVISTELFGILRWIETLVAIVAIGLIIVQAAVVLGSFGSEDRIRKAYRAVAYTVFGILLIVFDEVIARVFGLDPAAKVMPTGPTTLPLFTEAFGFLRFALLFVGIIVIGVIIYAGGLMLLHYGNDEFLNRAKTTLINALIGLVFIVVAFLIVSTVILGLQ